MPIFDKHKLTVISAGDANDLSNSSLNKNLSVVNYDPQKNQFYITFDKIAFTNPVATIEKVLEAQGYVINLENILSCLDSFVFSAHARVKESETSEASPQIVDYFPCMAFSLPRKHSVGDTLQRFYDEVAKLESGKGGKIDQLSVLEYESRVEKLQREITKLREENNSLNAQIQNLTEQLIYEKRNSKQILNDMSSSDMLPGNTRVCRVEHVDLKKRLIKVRSLKKIIDIPTHLLDRVPEFKSRCIITFDDDGQVPLGILFFDNKELESIENRVADLLVVDGDTFKARDSMRNEFQIKAINDFEADTIRALRRGMKVLVAIADDYIVRFSVLGATNASSFNGKVLEQLTVYDIGRNQLVMRDVEENAQMQKSNGSHE